MRKKIVAGNWKMNKTLAEARALTAEVIQLAKAELSGQASLILCTPFLYLHEVNSLLVGTGIAVGAQNCSEHDSGAYTGEVSAIMIQSLNVPYVILGHSERRQYFHLPSDKVVDTTCHVTSYQFNCLFNSSVISRGLDF